MTVLIAVGATIWVALLLGAVSLCALAARGDASVPNDSMSFADEDRSERLVAV